MSVAQAYAILEHSSVVELPAYIRRVPGSIPGVPIFLNGGIAMISEFVEYVKQAWKNKPNVSSPLNADRLNHMEAGIENNSKKIKETVTAVNELTEKREWTKVSFVGTVDVAVSVPSDKCARVPSTAEEICVEITVKRNASTSIKFSQYIKTYGSYLGGYYNSDKYYASYQLGYNNNIIYLSKSWLKVVDNGTEYNNADTVKVDVYYR